MGEKNKSGQRALRVLLCAAPPSWALVIRYQPVLGLVVVPVVVPLLVPGDIKTK